MILTLALFLSPKERKMSRLVCSDLGKVEPDVYEPDVFLQGFVLVSFTLLIKLGSQY